MHGTEKVLDPEYSPMNEEELELFEQYQKFMYNVVVKMVNTTKRRLAVKQFHNSKDAQSVYAESIAKYEHGMTEDTLADGKRRFIIDMHLGQNYNKGYLDYLNKWEGYVLDLEELQ